MGGREREINHMARVLYLWKYVNNLLHLLLKVCFQYPVGFVNHEALANHAKSSGLRIRRITKL